MQIEASEVVAVLRRALTGEIGIRLIGTEAWGDVGSGNFEYAFGDWRITFFNDVMELDYVDSVIAPDGRTVEYSEWFIGDDRSGADPIDLLEGQEVASLEGLLERTFPS